MAAKATSGTKQRRGKKETNDNSTNVDDQLARAQAAVQQSEYQTSILHKQWRTYLLRLSYLLILVSMHQMQEPTGACLKDVKALNEIVANDDQKIPGWQAFLLVVSDAMPYVLAMVMSGSLSFFLVLEEPGTFSHPRYLLATCLTPILVGIHFWRKDKASCLDDELLLAGFDPEPRKRSLPVVVIFHVIVTGCYWFMDTQRQQQARNARMVQELQRDLDQARKGKTTTKSTQAGQSVSKKSN